ncbi:hypothetical protein [Konateibacter massiliensis]|uniref:hypothetical protein n=1 Tax=Konateibacter massiliensis TaxID=2002841 RepID=UPI000C15E878
MSKKTITFYALAALFFISSFSGFSSGNTSGAIGCIIIAVVLGVLGYRSHSSKKDKSAAAPINPSTDLQPDKQAYDFFEFKVAGVTFKNGRKSRQTILRAVNFKDAPFDKDIFLELRPYEYEGQPAYGVYVNDEQIGSVPKEHIAFISDNYSRIDALSNIKVYGGGRNEVNKPISYGAVVTVRLKAI